MTAAATLPARRGWCPGVRRPMVTGDGLLVRIHPPGGMLGAAEARLAASAATEHGNGLLDVSARGNLQLRGIREASHPALVRRLAEAGLAEAAGDGPHRLTVASPLAGLDPADLLDARALADAVEEVRPVADLPPKTCVAVDGGGSLPLCGVGADLHLVAVETKQGVAVAVGLATVDRLLWAGAVAPEGAAPAVRAILMRFSGMRRSGKTEARRIRDLDPDLRRDLAAAASLSPPVIPPARPLPRRAGPIDLGGGEAALLIALPFGRCDGAQLARTADWSERFGNGEIRLSFTRGFLLSPIRREDMPVLVEEGRRAGFIVADRDPHLSVLACSGAPACANAFTSTREDAAAIVKACRPLLESGASVHVSGCAKGCAHAGMADLTLVGAVDGAYGVIVSGRPRDAAPLRLAMPQIIDRLRSARSVRDLSSAFPEASP